MTQDPWIERISEYLDEELGRDERAALEAHLRGCAECASLLEDLRRVRARARALKDSRPPEDLWPAIAATIAERSQAADRSTSQRAAALFPRRAPREDRAGGRFAFSLPQLVAACLTVAITSGGTVYAILKRGPSTVSSPRVAPSQGVAPSPRTAVFPAPDTGTVVASAGPLGESPREEAVIEIRRALARGRGTLDPLTVRTLESNLAIIEIAIDQAERALAADPANAYVREHLAATMKRKVELLQRATVLASASSSEVSR